MLLVLVGNATSSTSLVTEQEGLTWLHASTRARTHANARTQVRNTYARTRGVSRTRSVSYLELKPLKCAVVFYGRHDFVARGDEYRRVKFDDFREGKHRTLRFSACQRLATFLFYTAYNTYA